MILLAKCEAGYYNLAELTENTVDENGEETTSTSVLELPKSRFIVKGQFSGLDIVEIVEIFPEESIAERLRGSSEYRTEDFINLIAKYPDLADSCITVSSGDEENPQTETLYEYRAAGKDLSKMGTATGPATYFGKDKEV